MKYKLIMDEEIIGGTPLHIEMELKREMIQQIQDLGANNYEDITMNMRLFSHIFEILEENINEDFILLKYNPMGSWYKEEDKEEIEYYKNLSISL